MLGLPGGGGRFAECVLPAREAHDADAFAEVFTEDASFIVPDEGTYLTSGAETRAYMTRGFAGALDGVRATVDVLDVEYLGDDTGVVTTDGWAAPTSENTVPSGRVGRQSGRFLIPRLDRPEWVVGVPMAQGLSLRMRGGRDSASVRDVVPGRGARTRPSHPWIPTTGRPLTRRSRLRREPSWSRIALVPSLERAARPHPEFGPRGRAICRGIYVA